MKLGVVGEEENAEGDEYLEEDNHGMTVVEVQVFSGSFHALMDFGATPNVVSPGFFYQISLVLQDTKKFVIVENGKGRAFRGS